MTTPRSDLPALAFIGGGQMARALIGGLAAGPLSSPAMWVSDPGDGQRAALAASFPGVRVLADNESAAAAGAVWVLAVKPQQIAAVARQLAPLAERVGPLVISVAAGIRTADLQRWLGASAAIVRAMPNRPALIGAGVTALYAPPEVSTERRALAAAILGAVGSVVWVGSDAEIDAATAVSGSGPAYFLRLIELLEEAGVAAGLDPVVAHRLALDTALGTARLAHGSTESCAELRASVTSAGGTTAAALAVLEAADLRAIVGSAVGAAARRAAELADEFGRT
jgi:pyrroline-5-carboxylate reductase